MQLQCDAVKVRPAQVRASNFWLCVLQVQLEFDTLKAQPLKMNPLEAAGLQIQLAAASKIPDSHAAAPLPGTSIRSLLQDMGLQVCFSGPQTASMSAYSQHVLRAPCISHGCVM